MTQSKLLGNKLLFGRFEDDRLQINPSPASSFDWQSLFCRPDQLHGHCPILILRGSAIHDSRRGVISTAKRRAPLVIAFPDPKNGSSKITIVGRIQVDVDLKWCDAMGVDPCDTDELKLIRAGACNFKVNNSVRPPVAQIFWAVAKTVANKKLEQVSNLLVEHPHGLGIGARTNLPCSKAFQKPCLYQGAISPYTATMMAAIQSGLTRFSRCPAIIDNVDSISSWHEPNKTRAVDCATALIRLVIFDCRLILAT